MLFYALSHAIRKHFNAIIKNEKAAKITETVTVTGYF